MCESVSLTIRTRVLAGVRASAERGGAVRSDLRSKVGQELPQSRQNFALKLRELRGCVPGSPAARDFITWLAAAGYAGLSPSSLSRYYSGKDVPPERFVDAYYGVVRAVAGGRPLPCLLDELLDLRNSAEAADGRRNTGLRLQIRVLEAELSAARAGRADKSTPLPVPFGGRLEREGGEERESSCAAARLSAAGNLRDALIVLEGAAHHFSVDGVALMIRDLYDLDSIELVENLVKLFSRVRSVKETVALSQALRKEFPDASDLLLRMITD